MSADLVQRRIIDVPFIALDLEATGAAAGHDRIMEVGAARFHVSREGQVVPGETLERLVNPERPVPALIQELTGIEDQMLVGAPLLDEIWDEIWDFLGPRSGEARPVLLAHKAQSDLTFLAGAAHRLGRPLGDPLFVCTLNISRAVFTGAPSHKLGELVTWLGCDPSDQRFHRALPDALHTRNLFGRAIAHQSARTLGDLGVTAAEPHPTRDIFEIVVPGRLAELKEALEAARPIQVVYRGGSKGRDPRLITPMAFYNYSGHLWVRGVCHMDDATKSFRCDRLRVIAPDP